MTRLHASQEGSQNTQIANSNFTYNYNFGSTSSLGKSINSGAKRGFRRWSRKHKWIFAGATIAIITAVVVLCVLLLQHRSSRAQEPLMVSDKVAQVRVTYQTYPEQTSPASPAPQPSIPAATPSTFTSTSSPPGTTTPSPFLGAGAICTADSQCSPPNPCQSGSYTNTVDSKVYATRTCCGPSQWGCPGWECKDYNDCLDPWKCAGTGSVKTCCGPGAPYTGEGC